jgi:glycosyltransferase involved in cell wall biosynthesis
VTPLPAVLAVTNMWPTADDPTFGVFVKEQVEAVRALGVRVDVHFVDGRRSRLAYARAVPAVRRRLRAARYDLVHAHYVLAGLVAWLAGARRPGRPLVLTHYGIEVFEGWQAPLAAWLTRRADRTLVLGPAMARHLGVGPEAVVPLGVDLGRFRPGPKAEARAALGLPAERPLVAWVAADRPEKRLWLARAAVDELRRSLPGAELLVVGGRPHEEVPRYLQAADVLLVTSTREGGPLVVKEALACNRPVVSTDVGDVAFVVGGLPGCAVVPGEPAALAAALGAALAAGEIDGRSAVARYGKSRIAERVREVYLEVAGRAPAG